ncbi:periplasmic heavy metal sensor [Telmatospirillum sp. J64-1]|uniref:periplasmic heavy metal sensor n=1 Tax=Telmatospirillum sp. J64-1 TaxID=2502183 RepID=UPI00115DAFFD|nr:periplasmic heavy metal sensor [Telmatospirillum sp. J64-1]
MIVSGRMARLLLGALILSVCLNLFAAAAFGGRFLAQPERGKGQGGIERMVHSAPEAARPLFAAKLEENQEELTERSRAMAEARREVARLLRSEGMDAAAYEAAFAQLRERMNNMHSLIDSILIETLAEVSPEIRAEWAQRWERRR